jgi:hypothetical protein
MVADFTRAGYAALLDAFAALGYTCRGFGEVESGSRHLVLRHDLDMSLDAAVPIAEIEAARGLRATYFVLVGTEMYNPFSPAGRQILARLSALGHAVGLHFDVGQAAVGPSALDDAVAAECGALEAILGVPVETVSFHRPAAGLWASDRRPAGRRHAYERRYVEEIGYCSDSRGGWHHGHPLDHASVGGGTALQLLTHPIWWPDAARPPVGSLDEFLAARLAALDSALAANCAVHEAGRHRLARR